jgi:hypothetical protein
LRDAHRPVVDLPTPPVRYDFKGVKVAAREMSNKQDDEDIADYAAIHGDDIMAEAARERMANGDWSQEDLDWLWEECRRRLGPFITE